MALGLQALALWDERQPTARQAIASVRPFLGPQHPTAMAFAGTSASSASQTGHLGRRAGDVDEDQSMDRLAHARLAVRLPLVTRLAHVLALGLGRQQRFF